MRAKHDAEADGFAHGYFGFGVGDGRFAGNTDSTASAIESGSDLFPTQPDA